MDSLGTSPEDLEGIVFADLVAIVEDLSDVAGGEEASVPATRPKAQSVPLNEQHRLWRISRSVLLLGQVFLEKVREPEALETTSSHEDVDFLFGSV